MLDKAYRDDLEGKPVNWNSIPWAARIDVSVSSLRKHAEGTDE
jgi:hypothetical protein